MNCWYRTAVFSALVLVAGSAFADRDWYRYENDSFIVYSDASKRQVRNAVKHLELFRAAVTQVANITIPDDAPKVRLVMVDSHARFNDIIGSEHLGGAAFEVDGVPHMAVPSGSKSLRTEWSLRHHYAHILLTYKNYPYPTWFDEGFAEIMDQTTFRDRNRIFSLGEPSPRQIYDGGLRPWEEVLDPTFEIDAIDFVGDRSDARLQCWALAYYFMLDDDFGNTTQLQQYLNLLAAGHDSVEAMETVVGEPVVVWARRQIRKHVHETQRYYTIDLKEPPSYSKLSERTPVPASEVEQILDHIRGTRRHN